jgi:hypothetical protein
MSVDMDEDIAAKVVEENTERIHVTAIEERRIRKAVGLSSFRNQLDSMPERTSPAKRSRSQFDRRVVPIVCVAYVLSYLDRGNIGNAKCVDHAIRYVPGC